MMKHLSRFTGMLLTSLSTLSHAQSQVPQCRNAFAAQGAALTGTPLGDMPIPANGLENAPITFIRTLPPETRIGYSLAGLDGVSTAAASFTFDAQGCKL
jgi:hypothetical protein